MYNSQKNTRTMLVILATLCIFSTSILADVVTNSTRILIDCGGNTTDGTETISPSNGVYWNNIMGGSSWSAWFGYNATYNNMISSSNETTTIDIILTGTYIVSANGACSDPNAQALGDLAITTATDDFFESDSHAHGITLSGLNSDSIYDLSFFAAKWAGTGSTNITRYTIISGAETSTVDLVTGYDGHHNTADMANAQNIKPDSNNQIVISISTLQGGNSRIGILEIEEKTVIDKSPDGFLVDFGPNNDDDGRATSNPDINNNYWNNWRPTWGGGDINAGTILTNMIDKTGRLTELSMEIIGKFNCNGRLNGGLLAPSAFLLGDFAINTATEDYFFGDNNTYGNPGFYIKGLTVGQPYSLRIFGTRELTEIRKTQYTATGDNGSLSASLITSGLAVGYDDYNGNNDAIAVIKGVLPNENGEIIVGLSLLQGNYCYLGIIEVTKTPPPQGTIIFIQ